MKFTKTKTDTVEVEITFPHYRKTVCHTYKVINEHRSICVTNVDDWKGISEARADLAWNLESTECTEEYYNEQFNQILKSLSV
jgi:hypothetical protein